MSEPQAQHFEFGEFRIDACRRLLVNRNGEVVPLTPKVFDLLLYLVRHNGEVLEKDKLMTEIWVDTIVEENNLSQNISILRRVLGEKRGEHRFIATVPGQGYKFVADVTEVSSSTSQALVAGKSERDNQQLQNGNQVLRLTENNKTEPNISNLNNGQFESLNLKSEENGGQRSEPETQSMTDNRYNQKRNWLIGIVVFSVLLLGSFGFYLWKINSKSANVPIKTIAVLPFKPLVVENRDEVLEMGMADTLISRLGNNREIVVRPLTSVRRYGNLEQDAIEAGRTLEVEAVLDGNVQRWGDKIRVNVRLIKVADGTLFWTGTFDERFTNIFVVQDAIANRVAAALALPLSSNQQTKLEKRPTNNAQAYELYLRGRYHYNKSTAADHRKSINFYEQAIALDPNYALAYAGMADAYRTLAIASFAPAKEVCPQAKEKAKRALEIDESLAEAHIALSWIVFIYDWDWNTAETEAKKAIALEPNNSEAHRVYAHILSIMGRHDEAVTEGRRARELDPLTLLTSTLEGQFLGYAGRHEEAIERLQKTLELDPNYWVAHNVLGRVYTRQERYAEAVAELTKARELSGGSIEPAMQLGYALAKLGRRKEAEALLAELKLLATNNFVAAYHFAMIYNGLGEKEEALNYLEKSFAEREAQLAFVNIDPRWNPLRSEPRFAAILRRMNFAPNPAF